MNSLKNRLAKEYREMQPNLRAALQVMLAGGLLWLVTEVLIRFGTTP